jgi:stage II sporulation protein P
MDLKNVQKWINIVLWFLIVCLGSYIIVRGVGLLKTTSVHVKKTSVFSTVSGNLDKWAMETYMPNFMYPISAKEETSSIEAFVIEKLFETIPIYAFVKENSSYDTEIENLSTYEMILEAEADDEYDRAAGQEETTEETQTAAEAQTEISTEQSETTEMAEADTVPVPPAVDTSLEKLNDFDYLLNNFYTVDKTTTINSNQLNASDLLGNDLSIVKDNSAPQILIYHTHSQEEFIDSIPGDPSTSIVGVGEYLSAILREQYGYNVIHHTGVYDMVNGKIDRDKAYTLAGEAVTQILDDNPSIQVVIDLHRDGVEGKKFVTEINGKPTARFMFFNGLSRTTKNGEIEYLPNPYIADNLAFSFQLQLKAAQYYPGLTRNIYLRGLRYNLHLKPRTLLIESGTQLNTVQEEMNAMEPLADMLNQVLSGT